MKKTLLSWYFKYWHFKWNVPKYDITLTHRDSDSKFLDVISDKGVRIVREKEYGFPHIFGKTKNDVFFGQGFVQAQERLSQLEILRRLSTGTMSELNEKFLFVDKMVRTIGITNRNLVKAYTDELKKEDIERVRSYCSGINFFLHSKYYQKPLALSETGNPDVKDFTVRDIINLLIFICWQMNMGGWMIKIVNATLMTVLDESDMECFQIGVTKANVKAHQFYHDLDWKEVSKFLKMSSNPGGSNCVAISGKFTKSGGACLFNDTHLSITSPSFWFPTRIVCDEFDATGFSATGTFGLCIGHNRHISWGVTLSLCDMYEIYLEEIDPRDPGRYLHHIDEKTGEKVYRKFDTKVETIEVKGFEDLEFRVRSTERGNIISDVWDNVNKKDHVKELMKESGKGGISGICDNTISEKNQVHPMIIPEDDEEDEGEEEEEVEVKYALAFKSVFTSQPVKGSRMVKLLDIMSCKNYEEFRETLYNATMLNLNMLYADKEGNIGYYMTGSIPKRSREAQARSNLPVPGWLPEKFSWGCEDPEKQRYYDVKKNPQCYNPKCGFIVSCNQEMVSQADREKYYEDMFFGRVHLPVTRARRMTKVVIEKFRKIEQEEKKDQDDEEEEGEEDSDDEKIMKRRENKEKVDTEFGKYLQGDIFYDDDTHFLDGLAASFVERRAEIEKKRIDQKWKMTQYFERQDPTISSSSSVNNDTRTEITTLLRREKIHLDHVYGVADEIARWDHVCDLKSIGATVSALFELEMMNSVLMDGGGKDDFLRDNHFMFTRSLFGNGIVREFWRKNEYKDKTVPILELLLDPKKLEKTSSLGYQSCLVDDEKNVVDLDYLLFKVLVRVILLLRKMKPKVKKSPGKWEQELGECVWGKFHTITWKHSTKDFTNKFDIGPFPCVGSSKTPNAFGYSADLVNLETVDLPSQRFVVDMGDPLETCEGIVPPGVSENPCSKHYDDMAQPYINHVYLKMECPTLEEFTVENGGVTEIRDRRKRRRKKKKKEEEEIEEEED